MTHRDFIDDEPAMSDEEICALAESMSLDAGLAPDAVAWQPERDGVTLLPEWYMPLARTRSSHRWPMVVSACVIAGFLLVDACGLCLTSGFLSWA